MSMAKKYAVGSAPFMIGMALLLLSNMGWTEALSRATPGVQTWEPHGETAEWRQGQRKSAAEKTFPQGPLILKNTRDGTIQVLDSDGRVQKTYPPGSLSLSSPTPAVLERMKNRREEQKEWAKERAQQFAQEREEEARAAKEAAQKGLTWTG